MKGNLLLSLWLFALGVSCAHAQLSHLSDYQAKVAQALKANPPLLTILPLNGKAQGAVNAALAHPQVRQFFYESQSGAACRVELFSAGEAAPSDLERYAELCGPHGCYRLELYNFTLNSSLIVTVQGSKVVDLKFLAETQPEIPKHLEEVALEIATKSPRVREALGKTPQQSDAIMASTKTALNATRCERSRHLCVAPTFVLDGKALWTIVDLTDMNVAGVRWTRWEDTPVTEGQLLDQQINAELCQAQKHIERDGWKLSYGLTGSDGLRVSDVSYQGQAVMASAKNVDWHVSYSGTDGFGYSDAVGCPLFSTAAVIPSRMTELREISQGFELVQEFRSKLWPLPCNYSYAQHFQFWRDGSFRVVVANLGRGCGANGTYRPVIRVAVPFKHATFEEWNGERWVAWEREQWRLQTAGTAYWDGRFQYRIKDSSGAGYYIEPGHGQFGDQGRGDNAFMYVTRQHPEEGADDLLTIGPCCNSDHAQGPERFLNDESILSTELVLWYVPQLANDGTPGAEYCWASAKIVDGKQVIEQFPCPAGPKFVPIQKVGR